MKYSQNNEEEKILEYFGDRVGNFLDIGAYDGVRLSNTAALIDAGWGGVLVEPHPEHFLSMFMAYRDHPNITMVNAAVSTTSNLETFYFEKEWGSTILPKMRQEQARLNWLGTYQVYTLPIQMLFLKNWPSYDFISIDTEGMDYILTAAIRPFLHTVSLMCVEHGGRDRGLFMDLFKELNWVIYLDNGENFLVGRPK